MEVFQNGKFSTGEPVYQIGTKNADGTYDVKVFDLMTKAQAEAKLKSMGVTSAVPPVSEYEERLATQDVPNYSDMTKVELEALMREHGIELDRRKTKGALLKQVKEFFNG